MKLNRPALMIMGFTMLTSWLSIKAVFSSPIKFGNGFIAIDGERARLDKLKPDLGCGQFAKQDLNDNRVNFENQVLGNGLPLTIDENHFRWGFNSIRFQVKPQLKSYDCSPGINDSFAARSEIWLEGDKRTLNPNIIPFEQQRFTGFSFKVPHDFSCPKNGSEFIIMQWWQRSPLGPPLRFSLICDGSKPPIIIRLLNLPESASPQELFRSKIQRAEWYDVVLEYKLSQSSSGYVNLWFKPSTNNRYATYSFSNLSLGFSGSEKGLFHKFGIYRPSANAVANNDITWFDEVRNGTTWSDVAPDPLPSGLNYTIRSLGASVGTLICIAPNAVTLDSIINLVSCNDRSKQQNWSLEYQPDTNAYQVRNRAISKSCLGAVGTTSRSQVTLQSCQSDNNQQLWRVTKVRNVSKPDQNDLGFQLQMGSAQAPTRQCLDLVGFNIGDATKINSCIALASKGTVLKSDHSLFAKRQKVLDYASRTTSAGVVDVTRKSLSRTERARSDRQVWRFW